MTREVYKYCKATKSVLPIEEARARDAELSYQSRAVNNFTTDTMDPTRHPITGEYFTSKEKFRAVTRSHGYDEVGNEYEKGFDPGKEAANREKVLSRNIRNKIGAYLNGYGERNRRD